MTPGRFLLLIFGLVCLAIAGGHFASANGWIGEGAHAGSPFVLFGFGGMGFFATLYGIMPRP